MNPRTPSSNYSIVGRTFKRLPVVVLVALVASCANVNRLREAQDSFNQAAAAENALRFDARTSDAVAGLVSIQSGYASALLSLEKLEDSKDQAQLRNDGLWGTALTLKALTQWRLGQFEKAIATSELAKQSAGDQLYPRDLAVITALPGLVKTDQAYEKILRNDTLPEVEALLIGERGAVANIQSARGKVDKDHPVQIYLLQAQLAAYRNYQVGLFRLGNHAVVDTNHPARVNANAQVKELDQLLKAQKAESGDKLVRYWVGLCTLDAP